MTDENPSAAPYFPAPSPSELATPDGALALLTPVLDALAGVVDVPDAALADPTPCAAYDLSALRDHVLGWLQLFAASMADPAGAAPRPDAGAYRAADDDRAPSEVVRAAAARAEQGIRSGALDGRVLMSAAFMDGPAGVAMYLGEYLVHGWDLATAQGLPWQPDERACEVALDFFRAMVAPEYRGGEHGMFAEEVAVPDDAPALHRLLGFAGRDPEWKP